ncbi:MAG: hypothetical protein HY046_06395 [Acidobacteria bacterium]|nr:hypothetical protein [Acidobacteriota bacterium]
MDRHHINEEQMVAMHYGDVSVDERAVLDRHMITCDSCRASFEDMRNVLAMVSAQPVPEPGDDFERRVWQHAERRLPARKVSWWGFLLQPQKMALAGAMAMLLLVGFLVGRGQWPFFTGEPNQTESTAVNNTAAREQLLLAAVGDHFERSQRMLTEINNAPEGRANISGEQQSADDLVLANRLYRQTAAQSGETRLVSLLDELERTLLEISHGPKELSKAEMDRLRKRISQRELLFKLRVVGEQVREEQKQKVRDRSRQTF